MPAVLAKHPDAHCVIVGGAHAMEADYESSLRAQIEGAGLRERVVMAGFQSAIPEWMQAMDVIVHASDTEPFGIVVIEAMALGKAVVAGSEGGPKEIITDGVDGLLAPYGDAPRLASQILRFLDDPAFMQATGAAARERALQFAPERYAEQFVAAVSGGIEG
jgi:glycosyltransferase involved in cell wall biosynthesis